MRQPQNALSPTLVGLAALVLFLPACGSSGGSSGGSSDKFKVRSTSVSVAATTPLCIAERFVAFLTDEQTTDTSPEPSGFAGTDLNNDGDSTDSIVTVVNMKSRDELVLNVAVAGIGTVTPDRTLAFAGEVLFMVVDEVEDGRDWNNVPNDDALVLLCWQDGDVSPVYLDDLAADGDVKMVSTGAFLVYASATSPSAQGETNLRLIDATAPMVTIPVTTPIVDPDGVTPHLIGEDEGLVFLYLDEDLHGENFNGDGDEEDEYVLALLDGTEVGHEVLNTGTAVEDEDVPFRAAAGADDWLVAYLVDEQDQDENLNDPGNFGGSWIAQQCLSVPDIDMDDEVLAYIEFADFEAGMNGGPFNTGLVGMNDVYILGDYVGTLTLEEEEGDNDGCDLNNDGDEDDTIFRWMRANGTFLPVNDANKLHAVADVPGGTYGVVALDDTFWVVLVDEAADDRDHDGDNQMDKELIGVHDPTNVGTQFNFDQGGGVYVGATWMAPDPADATRFLLAFPESVAPNDLNGDADTIDSVPTFPEVGGNADLDFPGIGVALHANNAGMVTADGVGYFRVSEAAEDGNDLNDDGDSTDYVLMRIALSGGSNLVIMGTLNSLSIPAIFAGPDEVGGAFITQEALEGPSGTDFNDDGDTDDYVVRFFEM